MDKAELRDVRTSIHLLWLTFRDCFKFGNPNTIVKHTVGLLGYPVGKCRAPFNQVSPQATEALKKVIAENQEKGMK